MADDFFNDDLTPRRAAAPEAAPAENDDPAPDDPAQDPAAPPPAAEVPKHRREIDLGDGSGKQVFEADTPDGLLDKLAEAQTNATRKIRELTTELRTKPAATPEPARAAAAPKVLTADEKYLIAEEFKTDPDAAMDRLMKAKAGMTMSEFTRTVEQVRRVAATMSERSEAEEFLAKHPDYRPTARNGKTMSMYIKANGLEPTAENFEKAYQELGSGGLLETTAEKPQPAAPPRAEVRPSRSGLSPRSGRGEQRAPAGELTPEEANRLPLDELKRRIALQHAAAERSA
jgi:hypothetical protein